MDALWIIIGIHAVLLGFAFAFAGFMVIAAPSIEETESMRTAYRVERAKSWLHGQIFAWRQASRSRARGLSMFIAHWPERQQGRRLLYFGASCLVIAAVVGYHFGMFHS
jgi:hypothetical protein